MTGSDGRSDYSGARTPTRAGVTWRAVVVALVLMPFQSWWIVQMEVIRFNSWPTMLSLPLHTVFILLD